jgi:Flp pilus assembly protein TadD
MAHPVFLSYARSASASQVRAVFDRIGGEAEGTAFLDTSDIEHGDRFPQRLVDALLAAQVIVIFPTPLYFRRWYCLLELRVARAAFQLSLEMPNLTPAEREALLAPIVVALPPAGMPTDLDRLPPALQGTNWPSVDDPDAVAALVRTKLDRSTESVGNLLSRVGAGSIRDELLEATRLPPPRLLDSERIAPEEMRLSIGEAFVGRADELWRTDDLLVGRGPDAAPPVVWIEGGGGVGKTQLAVEYLHRFGPKRFPGGLFWIDADVDPVSLEARQHEILTALDPATPPLVVYHDPDRVRSVAKDLRQAASRLPTDRPALFVVDNVPEPEPGRPPAPLRSWCPVVGVAPVLATSRSRVSPGERGSIARVALDILDEGAAVALLTRAVRGRAALADEEWLAIANWVGRLPLALELLNASVAYGAVSAASLLDASRTRETSASLDEGMDSLRFTVPEGTLRGVTEAFSMSYDRLTPTEQQAARMLAWLAPDPIPEALLDTLGAPPFTGGARAVLVHRSFVLRLDSGDIPVFGSMHRVLASFLRTRSTGGTEELRRVGSALVEVMTPVRVQDPAEWRLMNLFVPHALAVFERGAEPDEDAVRLYVDLGVMIGLLLQAQGYNVRAESVVRQAFDVSERVLGGEHAATLTAMNNLGMALQSQGDMAGARALQEQVLEISRRALGEEHPDSLIAMNNLAMSLYLQGDFAAACDLQQQVLDASLRTLGTAHPSTARAIGNLAMTLQSMGDLASARDLQQEVLTITRRTLGEDHPYTLSSMGNLAMTLHLQGELPAASEL